MLALALGLAVTGAFMGRVGDVFEELHEVLAWAMVVVVVVHVVGIVWHTIRHRENIAISMLSGAKQGDPAQAIGSSHALVGIAFLALTGLWAGALVNGYDGAKRSVTLVGATLQLGEGDKAATTATRAARATTATTATRPATVARAASAGRPRTTTTTDSSSLRRV